MARRKSNKGDPLAGWKEFLKPPGAGETGPESKKEKKPGKKADGEVPDAEDLSPEPVASAQDGDSSPEDAELESGQDGDIPEAGEPPASQQEPEEQATVESTPASEEEVEAEIENVTDEVVEADAEEGSELQPDQEVSDRERTPVETPPPEESEAGAPPAAEQAAAAEPSAETGPVPDGVEDYVEPGPAEPYWKEGRDGMNPDKGEPEETSEPPLSAWESSLIEAKKEEEDPDEEGQTPEEEREAGDEDFRWPTVEEGMRDSDAGGGPSAQEPGPTGKTPDIEKSTAAPAMAEAAAESRRSEAMTEENMAMETSTGDLQSIQETLQKVFSELEELRGSGAPSVTEGLTKAAETLEARHRRVMDLLRSNEGQARETKILTASVEKRQDMKKELESQIGELTSINEQLQSTGSRLESEKQNLLSEKTRATEDNNNLKNEARSLAEEIESLSNEKETLEKETVDLEKERNHLEEDVRRLTRLKEEYLANIARFRDES